MTRVYRPVVLDVDGETFQIHLGVPGKPRVFRQLRDGSVKRVRDDDKETLWKVAGAFGRLVGARKARDAAEARRHRSWHYRFARWMGELFARAWRWLRRAAGVDVEEVDRKLMRVRTREVIDDWREGLSNRMKRRLKR